MASVRRIFVLELLAAVGVTAIYVALITLGVFIGRLLTHAQ